MGAGVQSTAIALLIAEGAIPKPDFAVFADTGWEPPDVYEHLEKLNEEVLEPSGVKLVKVQAGNLYEETLSRYMPRTIPTYTRDPITGDSRGLTKRACTTNYKLGPIFRWIREQLGGVRRVLVCNYCEGRGERHAPWLVKDGQDNTWGRCSVCRGKGEVVKIGSAPKGAWAQCYIGFSADEIFRVGRANNQFTSDQFPLIDLGMDRQDCIDYLNKKGWTNVAKSACIGCPFRNDQEWAEIKADPEMWAQAVKLDNFIRKQPMMAFDNFLHKDRRPLTEVKFDLTSVSDDDDDAPSCSPYGCRSGDPIDLPLDLFGDFDAEDGAE